MSPSLTFSVCMPPKPTQALEARVGGGERMSVFRIYQELLRERVGCPAFWERGIEACMGCSYEQRQECQRRYDEVAEECWKLAKELAKKGGKESD